MSIISTEEKDNQALISVLSAGYSQPTAHDLKVPSTLPSAPAADSSDAFTESTSTVTTLAQAYPATTLKLKIILSK